VSPNPTGPYLPNYVKACLTGKWTILAVSTSGEVRSFAYTCGSRRCPKCRPYWGRKVYGRIEDALRKCDHENLVFAVFTLDQLGRYGGRRFSDAAEAMECLPWQAYLRRLKYRCRKAGSHLRYVATVEVHRNGWPHLNVIFDCPYLARLVRENEAELEQFAAGEVTKFTRSKMSALAHEAGFGPRCSFESVRSIEAVGKYISKVAAEESKSLGSPEYIKDASKTKRVTSEVTKASQDPVAAPANFRTLRSSRRFIPAKQRSKAADCERAFLLDENGSGVGRDRDRETGVARQYLAGQDWSHVKDGQLIDAKTGRTFETLRAVHEFIFAGGAHEVLPRPKYVLKRAPKLGLTHHVEAAHKIAAAREFTRPPPLASPPPLGEPPSRPAACRDARVA